VQAFRGQHATQLFHCERIVELLQHLPAKLVLHAQFLKFAREQRLVVRGVRHLVRLRRKRHRRGEHDFMPRAHEAGAERDGGDVSLARGTQTHDETQARLSTAPVWSGCGTMDGLNSAADSGEYSWVKYEPMSNWRSGRNLLPASYEIPDPGEPFFGKTSPPPGDGFRTQPLRRPAAAPLPRQTRPSPASRFAAQWRRWSAGTGA
jgi:hypothetical protein